MRTLRSRVFLFLLVVTTFLFTSCFNLEKVKHFRYAVTFETEKGTQSGFFGLELFTEGEKNKAKVDFSLDGDELSTTVELEGDELESAFMPLLFTHPTLASVMAPLGVVQGLVMAFSLGTPLQVGFEMKQKDDEGRTMEITVPSMEVRFGKEALWVESKVNGTLAFRALLEKESYFPLVVDIQDPETLEEGQKRVYFEIQEIEWRE